MSKKLRRFTLAAALTAVTAAGLVSATVAASATTATSQHAARTAAVSAGGGVGYNEAQVQSFLQNVLNEHHGDLADSYLTPDVAWHGGTVGTISGRDNVAGLFAGVVAALPNVHASVEDIFGQGDQVVVRLVVSGTQEGAILGIPATGRNVQWDAIDVFSLRAGKISAIWAGDDWTAILNDTGTYKAPWIP